MLGVGWGGNIQNSLMSQKLLSLPAALIVGGDVNFDGVLLDRHEV